MIAGKHFDPVIGLDVHIVQPPGPVPPVPIPHPFVGIIFDPFDYLPVIGKTVFINGLPAATAGTGGKAIVPHIPLGGMFIKPPSNECEVFMGSATVVVDGEPLTRMGMMVLSCSDIGMPAPIRAKGSVPASLMLPTSIALCMPMGALVTVGGPPTISMSAIGMRVGMSVLGKFAKKLRALQKASARARRLSQAVHKRAGKLMETLGVPPNLRRKVHNAICTLTGHPVDVATGRVFTEHVDLSLPGPLPFVWSRIWDSTSVYEGPLGRGWHHSYDWELAVDSIAAALRLPDGRGVALPALALDESFFHRDERLTFSRTVHGYFVRTADGLVAHFGQGREISAGTWRYRIVRLRTAAGIRIKFSYDRYFRLSEIIDCHSRKISVRYDGDGRIMEIRGPHPTSPSGEDMPFVRYGYDAYGRLVRSADALGQMVAFDYRGTLLVRETFASGHSFHFEYDGEGVHAKCLRTYGDGGVFARTLTYKKYHTTETNGLGHTTVHVHDGNGLVIKTVDARKNVTRYQHNRHHQLVCETNALRQDTVLEYDDRGNLVATTYPDMSKTTSTYDARDLLIAHTNVLGGVSRWTYDDRECLTQFEGVDGLKTRFEYGNGWLVRVTDPEGGMYDIQYDAFGNVASLTQPGRPAMHWRHDWLGRVRASIDVRGARTNFERDLLGRVVATINPLGERTQLRYDTQDNLISYDGPQGKIAWTYSALGRMTSRMQGGKTVAFHYNGEDWLTSVTNEQGAVYQFEHNELGACIGESGFGGVRRAMKHDVLGRVVEVSRPGFGTTKIEYTLNGQPSAFRHDDGTSQLFYYRKDGLLIRARNAQGKDVHHVEFERDALGRIVAEIQDGHWVHSDYNRLGQRIGVRSSLGHEQLIERDASGDVTAHLASQGQGKSWEARFERDSAGLELTRWLPGGIRSRFQRDALGRCTAAQVIRGTDQRLREVHTFWKSGNRIGKILDLARGETVIHHDRRGNLTWAQHGDGEYDLRMPDAVGNLFLSTVRDDRRYGPSGELLEEETAHGNVFYRYDSQGNRIEKILPDGSKWSYVWNASGQLIRVARPDGQVVEYRYDAFGRRISKNFAGLTTRFIWDGDVLLHEWLSAPPGDDLGHEVLPWPLIETPSPPEHVFKDHPVRGPPDRRANAQVIHSQAQVKPLKNVPAGLVTWVFDPESFTPAAKLVGGESYSIVCTDLGVPHTMFDAQGEVVWAAELGLRGQLRESTANRQACPFRFPGQYDDEESGLYYNRFRYYDPQSGGYISQDPIGLAGGTAVYGYVGDPTTWVDPWGLSPAHLALFENGASVFLPESVLTNTVPMFGQLGRPDGLFVTTMEAADEIERQAGGSRVAMKTLLGIPAGEWNEPIHRVDISRSDMKALRVATGKEAGANKLFKPGGYTSGGIPEAVIDPLPALKVKGRCVAT